MVILTGKAFRTVDQQICFLFYFSFSAEKGCFFSFQFRPNKESDFSVAFIFWPKAENSFSIGL